MLLIKPMRIGDVLKPHIDRLNMPWYATFLRRLGYFSNVFAALLYFILPVPNSFAQDSSFLAIDVRPSNGDTGGHYRLGPASPLSVEKTVWLGHRTQINGFLKVATGPECSGLTGTLTTMRGNKVSIVLEMPSPATPNTTNNSTNNSSAIKVSQTFNLAALICPHEEGASITRATIDATMPEHQHGMNYKPKTQLEAGLGEQGSGARRLTAQGMVFHMPGKWQIELQVFGKDRSNPPPKDFAMSIF
jgi:hypothetical protein